MVRGYFRENQRHGVPGIAVPDETRFARRAAAASGCAHVVNVAGSTSRLTDVCADDA